MGEYLAVFLYWFFELLNWVIIVRVLLSWFRVRPNVFTRTVAQIADPVLKPFSRIVPRIGMIDISPIVAILAVNLVSRVLMNIVLSI